MNDRTIFPFRNDAVFCKVLEKNPEIAKKILVLAAGDELDGLDLGNITIHRQEVVNPALDARSIRLDVYMTSTNFYADFEMQTFPEVYALRSRFYISLDDIESLKPGDDFKKLPKAIVIFICTHDPFNGKYAKYIAKERLFVDDDCTADVTVANKYDAKYVKIFLNTKHLKDVEHQNVCDELANLLEYVETSVANDEFTEKVDKQVESVNKTDKEFLMTLYEKLQSAKAEGKVEGIAEATTKEKIATVKRMAKKNMPIAEIAEFTELSIEDVQKIIKEAK